APKYRLREPTYNFRVFHQLVLSFLSGEINRRREVRTMTTQKQLSHLSFAAIMLVFAALPALAQTGSVHNQTVVATTSNLIAADQVAALRKNRLSIPSK